MCRVTGKGYMDVNRISGYIPGKIVFFLMQVWSVSPPTSLLSLRRLPLRVQL
jgi:6-phosphofructo-2-kinase/fructose-2,6-biphosphatase